MKTFLPLAFALTLTACQPATAQSPSRFNLDLEAAGTTDLPTDWIKWGTGEVAVDSLAHSGEQSLRLSGVEREGTFSSGARMIPANYRGSSITLTGYMKLEDVADGYAGLLLRIDGGGGVLAFDNMEQRGIDGTRDWEEYSITLDYPEGAENIAVAGLLTGSGTAWFDDFTITIDGENLETKAEIPQPTYAADDDHEFDGGSGVTFPELTPQRTDDLELLGRVWGFLKYHHPTIGRGERQWDYDLFRFLPDYLAAGTQVQREQLLEQWVRDLGAVADCTDCPSPEGGVARTAGRDWISDRIESPALRDLLESVYANRFTGNHYYIGGAPGIGNPNFRHERAYAEAGYPDAGFRLLALYRYWNAIRYYFPYVEETDRDWEEVLATYLPRFLEAEDELAYERAALELIGEVNDTHANLWNGGDRIDAARGDRYAAVHLRFAGGELVVTDHYNPGMEPATDLAVGDVITHIKGKPVAEIVAERSPYYPASNEAARRRDLATNLLRDTAKTLELTVQTEAGTETRTIPLFYAGSLDRYHWYPPRKEPSYEWLTKDIGYVTLQNIEDADVPVIRDTFQDARGIVIDIRNYPSTFVPFSLGSYLMAEDTPFVRFTRPSFTTPGELVWTDPVVIPAAEDPYKGRVVVLVNELTQSSAEYTSMAFRAGPRTTVIGSTTAGADGNVSRLSLPGGLHTMISGLGVFYPDRSPTQRVGIVPDVEVPLTVADVRAGRDAVLERAVEVIQQN